METPFEINNTDQAVALFCILDSYVIHRLPKLLQSIADDEQSPANLEIFERICALTLNLLNIRNKLKAGKTSLTKSEAGNLQYLFEFELFEIVRDDPNIDNPDWMLTKCELYDSLKIYLAGQKEA